MLVKEKLAKDNIQVASVNCLSSPLVTENLSFLHLHYQGKLVKENLLVCSRQNFLDKGTCQGKLASVNEA